MTDIYFNYHNYRNTSNAEEINFIFSPNAYDCLPLEICTFTKTAKSPNLKNIPSIYKIILGIY